MTPGVSEPTAVALILGPTAAGKTDLALHLAARLPVEIVSVDSAMVYRGLDVGSGKPSPDTLARYPHHLIDIRDPLEVYSAGQFLADAHAAIADITSRGKLPLLVGGTMLYFRALRRGLAPLPSADAGVRAQIDAEAVARGWPALHAELAVIDPVAAERIRTNDSQRIQRALEVFRTSGRTLTELHVAAEPVKSTLQFHAYAWVPQDRAVLYAAIEARFHHMMRSGFLDEVRRLRERGDLNDHLPAIRSVGYRQLWEHLTGTVALGQAIERAIIATRHLARRQLVWLRSDRELQWLDALDPSSVAQMERNIASLCRNAAQY
jgi:tRNA dimethylallyltransferase